MLCQSNRRPAEKGMYLYLTFTTICISCRLEDLKSKLFQFSCVSGISFFFVSSTCIGSASYLEYTYPPVLIWRAGVTIFLLFCSISQEVKGVIICIS
jgi:hypothetical protein